jgi:hypothetical protein
MKTQGVMLYKASMVIIFAAVVVGAVAVYTDTKFNIHRSSWVGVLMTLALVSTLVLALRRDTYLPFLGKAAMPLGMLQPSFPAMANAKISVNAPGATHVIYWAAERDAPDPYTAYAETSNGGLAAVVGGRATLKFKTPGQYSVGSVVFRRTLPRHVHWRAVYPNGMVSRVETTDVSM